MKYNIINNLSHYGDILAIPFFALLAVYLYDLQKKSILEYILFGFAIAGLVLDIWYTYIFLSRNRKS